MYGYVKKIRIVAIIKNGPNGILAPLPKDSFFIIELVTINKVPRKLDKNRTKAVRIGELGIISTRPIEIIQSPDPTQVPLEPVFNIQ